MILCDIGNSSAKFFIENKIVNYYKEDEIPSFNDDIFYISVNKKSQNKLLVIFILVTCRLIANDRTIYHTYLSQPSTNDIHPYSCQASQFQTHSKFQYHC